jgi:hypothetical protein
MIAPGLVEAPPLATPVLISMQRQKSAGGGRGRGQHRDYDNPNYGQPSDTRSVAPSVPSGSAAPAAAGTANQADPYAICECAPGCCLRWPVRVTY